MESGIARAFLASACRPHALAPPAPARSQADSAVARRAVEGLPWSSAARPAMAALAGGLHALFGRRHRRRAAGVALRSRNRGLDPKRLLNSLREVGIGEPRRPALLKISDTTRANSGDAALILREQRERSLAKGGAGLRPEPARRSGRLPLLVKYYKPAGLMATLNNRWGTGDAEDLRSVVVMAGDEFELDLYHPVGGMATKTSGLLLWSRSGRLTRELDSISRGVVYEFEAEVYGVVDEEKLGEQLKAGIQVGVPGFLERKYALLRSSRYLEGSSLQDPRTVVRVATREGRSMIEKIMESCGFKVAQLKRCQIGLLSLEGMEEGGLVAATEDEEEWACQLAQLPDSEYPPGRLPPPREEEEEEKVLELLPPR